MVPSYPVDAWTPPPVRLGGERQPFPASENRFLQETIPSQTDPIPGEPRRWRPSARSIGIVLGMSALIAGGVMLYRMGPPVTTFKPFSVRESPPAAAEKIPDVHPTTLQKPARVAPTAESQSRVGVPTTGAGQSDVLTVVATPAGSASQAQAGGRPSAQSSGALATAQRPPGGAAVTGASGAPGSAVAYIASSHVYSADDADVIPPETINPQKLGNLRTGSIKPDDKVTIEILIKVDGSVEAAWGRTTPRNIGESLLLATSLHAVKSWAFRPALKDGVPVAYRKLITFEGY